MDVGAFLVIVAMAVLAGLYISRPLFDHRSQAHLVKFKTIQAQNHEKSALLAEHDRVLVALQELDFDQQLGKIPAEDYPVQRAALLAKGAAVLKALNELKGSGMPPAVEEHAVAVAAGRKVKPPADDLEAQIAARRKNRTGKMAGFCPGCGKPVQKNDRFCSRCGTILE